jgi:hypothetical protein
MEVIAMAAPLTSDRPVTAPPAHGNRTAGVTEALCALGAIVLAILGLSGAARFFGSTAAIVVGAAFLFEVWAVTDSHHREHTRGVWGERLAGWVGIVFGVLALVHLAPTALAPIGVIVFGAGLVLGMGLLSRTGRAIAGVGVIVLGIIALTRLDPRPFTMIGVIAVAGVLLLTGPAMAWRGHGVRAPAV